MSGLKKHIEIKNSKISGKVMAPGSKSVMIRTVVAGLLSRGLTTIHNPSYCDDAVVAIKIAEKFGAGIAKDGKRLIINGGLKPFKGSVNCGESGLAIRLFASIAALSGEEVVFTGSGSLIRRPMTEIENALRPRVHSIKTNKGCLPIRIRGPLQAGTVSIDGSLSSQYLTGLLMALPMLKDRSMILVKNLKSKPYIDLTLKVLRDFGIDIVHDSYSSFEVPGNQNYMPGQATVEGDWSAAAFLLVAGAVAGSVEVKGLDPHSCQADKKILEVLKMAGAGVSVKDQTVCVEKKNLSSFDFDLSECPDLAPPLVAFAAGCSGTTRLTGAHRLEAKESSRGRVLRDEFKKLGVSIQLKDDILSIEGSSVHKGTIHSNNDHRIAMAASVIALNASGPVRILDPDCVSKSYPGFYRDLKCIGGIIYE